MLDKPTEKQARVISFIWEYQKEKGYLPSVTEVKKIMKVKSFQSVLDMLKRMEENGWILREKKSARSTRVSRKAVRYLADIGSYTISSPLEISADYKGGAFYKSSGTQTSDDSLRPMEISLLGSRGGRSTSTSAPPRHLHFLNAASKWVVDVLNSSSGTAAQTFGDFLVKGTECGFWFFVVLLVLRNFIEISFGEIFIIAAFTITFSLIARRYHVTNH